MLIPSRGREHFYVFLNCRMFQIECINEPIVYGIKRCIQENPAGLNNLSVIGEVINNAEKAMISIKETQIRPMSLCCLVPFFVKKIYIPTGIADSAKKACVYIIDMVISLFELFYMYQWQRLQLQILEYRKP